MRLAWILMLAACGHAAQPGSATPPGTSHATPPTCDELITHLAVVFGQHALAADDRKDLVASCNKSNPSIAERTCVMKAQSPADVDACGRALHEQAMPAPGAPDDPRADLVALAERVHAYLTSMGEPPPAAPTTPPAGTCCAAACAAATEQWTGPWQLVKFQLEHPTRWSFAIDRDDTGVIVRAIGCGSPAPVFALRVTAGAAPKASDVHAEAAPP
jgi:hypothetical protein